MKSTRTTINGSLSMPVQKSKCHQIPWHAYVNIQMSSNSLPSTERPWKHTHCGGIGELFEKCWITTWGTSPLWMIVPYHGKGGWIWKGEYDLSPLGKFLWSWHGHSYTLRMKYIIVEFCTTTCPRTMLCYIFY